MIPFAKLPLFFVFYMCFMYLRLFPMLHRGLCLLHFLLQGLVHVVTWRTTIQILEHGAEAGGIAETAGIHHLRHVVLVVLEQSSCLLQADVSDETMWCLVGQFLHLAMQVNTTDAHLLCDDIHAEV